jgi:transcription elongation factor Elf1
MPKTAKTLQASCPHCGGTEDALTIDLNDMELITCGGCGEEFTAEEALAITREAYSRWVAISEWLGKAPV